MENIINIFVFINDTWEGHNVRHKENYALNVKEI